MDMDDILGDNGGIILLQVFIIILAVIIMVLIFSDRATTNSISDKISKFKCPECNCPDCPDCNCTKEGCPDCVCPKAAGCPKCPDAPDCPKANVLTPEDIADAIFPGRNKGITANGKYHPLTGLGEEHIIPAYTESNLGGSSHAPVSFDASIALASKKAPPIGSGKGVFTPSKPGAAAPGAAAPGAAAPGAAAGAAAGAAGADVAKP